MGIRKFKPVLVISAANVQESTLLSLIAYRDLYL